MPGAAGLSLVCQCPEAKLAGIVGRVADPAVVGVVRWRRIDLWKLIKERGADYRVRYVGTLLKELGFSHISARPRHPGQDGEIVEA
jgi:transposase